MTTSTVTRKPHQRYYARDGTRLPGVTTVLRVIGKEALPSWANRLGLEGVNSTDYLRHVADAGTLAHAMIAHRLGGPVADTSGYDDDQTMMAENALSSFDSWAEGKTLETHASELSLTSECYRYGGTLDALLAIDGVLAVIDFKTSSRIYPDHLFQLAGYHQLLIENGYEVAEARVLQVGRTGGEEFTERILPGPEIEPYFDVFKAALSLYNAMKLATTEARP